MESTVVGTGGRTMAGAAAYMAAEIAMAKAKAIFAGKLLKRITL
jgi:hypothetical protein